MCFKCNKWQHNCAGLAIVRLDADPLRNYLHLEIVLSTHFYTDYITFLALCSKNNSNSFENKCAIMLYFFVLIIM
jgi:hypothetical protein